MVALIVCVAGDTDTEKSATTRLTLVTTAIPPPTALMLMEYCPAGVDAEVETLRVEVPAPPLRRETEFGLQLAVIPWFEGAVQVNTTVPLNPPNDVNVSVSLALAADPTLTVRVGCAGTTVKSATSSKTVALCESFPPAPAAVEDPETVME